MPLKLTVELGEEDPKTSIEAGRRGAEALSKGLAGWHCHWDAVRFLLDACRMKKARPQAERAVLAWCRASAGKQYRDGPANRDELIGAIAQTLREGMEVWPEDLDEPRKKQLERARSRKRTLDVSRRAVEDFEEFRAVFNVSGREIGAGLDISIFNEEWCLPKIDRYLGYWREQLAFIQSRIEEDGAE